jgi:hypothetical protein
MKMSEQDKLINLLEKDLVLKVKTNFALTLKRVQDEIAVYARRGQLDPLTMQKYSRLLTLEEQMKVYVRGLANSNVNTIKKDLQNQYKSMYYFNFYDFERTLKVGINFNLLDTDAVLKALENPFDRVGFLVRERENQRALVLRLQQELSTGLVRGEGYIDISKRISKAFDISLNNSLKIVRTEGHRVREEANFDSIKESRDLGINVKKEWRATLDDRTRDTHQELDGETKEIDEEFKIRGESALRPGAFGVAKEDINCRCTLRKVIEGYNNKFERASMTGYTAYKNYKEWSEERIV